MENEQNKLYPEDQARVDEFLKTGYNNVERKPFRPFRLLVILAISVSCMSGGSILLARLTGVY